jgi:hypothetical protein
MEPSPPGWLRTARIFALEQWWPPFWPHLEVDWDRARWTMQRLHLDTLQANALTKWGFYQTELVQPHPELGSRDILQEAQDFCRKHGYRWIIYSLFGHPTALSTQLSKRLALFFRPLIADTRPKPLGHQLTVPAEYQEYTTRWHFGDERYVTHCVFAAEPWIMAHLRELAERYDYDAAWLDGGIETGSMWTNDGIWNLCGCPVCQQAHWADFGRPLPLKLEVGDPRLPELWRWTMRRLDAVLSRAAAIFTRGRKLPLVGNVAFGTGPGCHYPPILKNLDGGLFEHAADQVDLVRKLGESRHAVEAAIHYPDCYDPWPRRVTSGWEVENKGLTILAHDGAPYLAMPGKYYYDESNDAPAERIFGFMEREKALLGRQRRYAFCAVASLPWLTPGPSLALHTACARGWVSAMLDTHVPVTTLPSHILEDPARLADYPVLILPHMDVLSREALLGIRSYVEAGGAAYLCGDLGRLDGNLQETHGRWINEIFDLAWRPLAGLSHEEQVRRCKFERDAPLGSTYDLYLRSRPTPEPGFPTPGAAIHPSHFGQTAPGASWATVAEILPTDEERPLWPAIGVKTLGKGRLVFSSVLWGKQYDERRAPALAAWMHALIRWLAAKPMPIEVAAPRALQLGATRVDDGWLVYLINQSNDVQGRRQEWAEMMKVAERPWPIGPATVTVSGARQATAIYGPAPDAITADDAGLCIQYADFQDHAVLHVR